MPLYVYKTLGSSFHVWSKVWSLLLENDHCGMSSTSCVENKATREAMREIDLAARVFIRRVRDGVFFPAHIQALLLKTSTGKNA
jgi:hypothetical protein